MASPSSKATLPDRADPANSELDNIDEQLANEAAQAIQQGIDDDVFDIEGDFLSQEQITQVMAAEAGQATLPAQVVPYDQPTSDAAHTLDTPATPPRASAAKLPTPESSDAELRDLDSMLAAKMSLAEQFAELPIADQPADLPIPDSPIPDSPIPDLPIPDSPVDLPIAELVEPPFADPIVPRADTQADPPPAAKHVDHPAPRIDARPAPPERPAPAVKPPSPAKAVTPTAKPADQPDHNSDAATPDAKPTGLPRWQRAIMSAAALADWPARSLSPRVKSIIGLVGAVLTMMGLTVWIVGSL